MWWTPLHMKISLFINIQYFSYYIITSMLLNYFISYCYYIILNSQMPFLLSWEKNSPHFFLPWISLDEKMLCWEYSASLCYSIFNPQTVMARHGYRIS